MVKLSANMVLSKSRATEIDYLKKLNCWGSELTDVSIIREMPQIQVISLSVNNIASLADFATCYNLEELFIRKNQIENLTEIVHLQKLPRLRNLWLADNPCAVGDLYRPTVLRTLPNLQKLDNLVVSDEELQDALVHGVQLGDPDNIPPRRSRSRPLINGTGDSVRFSVDTDDSRPKDSTQSTEQQTPQQQLQQQTAPPQTAAERTSPVTEPADGKEPETPPAAHDDDVTQPDPVTTEAAQPEHTAHSTETTHVLQAVLLLLNELQGPELITVRDVVAERLQTWASHEQDRTPEELRTANGLAKNDI